MGKKDKSNVTELRRPGVFKFSMGDKVRDTIVSGYEGVITGRVEYITGCAQMLVQPPMGSDGKYPDGRFIDEDRLELVQEQVHEHKVTNAGFDIAAPVK